MNRNDRQRVMRWWRVHFRKRQRNRPKSNIQRRRRTGGVWSFNWGGMFDSQYGAASFFIKLPPLMMNTEKPVWEDKGQPILSHQHLLSELGIVRKKA